VRVEAFLSPGKIGRGCRSGALGSAGLGFYRREAGVLGLRRRRRVTTIAVSLLTDKQAFQKKQAEEARNAGRRAGVEVEVVFADGHMTTQVQQLMNYVLTPPDKRPVALVLEPASADGFERVGQAAAKAGIGWIPIHCSPAYIPALKRDHPRLPIASVAVDDVEAGATQARQVKALLKNGGQIMLMQGPRGNSAATLRRQGLDRELKAQSKIHTLGELHADWTQAGAEQALGAFLRMQSNAAKPDLIVCQNDSMALGVERILRTLRAAWGKVPLLGCDGMLEEGQRFVKEGLLAATVITPATAGKGVELATKMLAGQGSPPSVLLPVESFPPLQRIK
jgi:ABC-type sugar transport system substrate-binding protein